MKRKIRKIVSLLSAFVLAGSYFQYNAGYSSYTGMSAVSANETVSFDAQQIIMDGTVGGRFYLSNYEDTYTCEVDGQPCAIKNINDRYCVEIKCAAKNLADKHTAVIKNGETEIFRSGDIDLLSVATSYLSNTENVTKAQRDFVRSLINYCDTAQEYFEKGSEISAVSGFETTDESDVLFKTSADTVSGSSDAFDYKGSSLLLRDQTVIRHYFTLKEGKSADGARVILYGHEYPLYERDGVYFFDIINMSPLNYDTKYSMELKNDTSSCTVKYSVRDYITLVHNKFKKGELSDSKLNDLADKLNNMSYYSSKLELNDTDTITGAYMIGDVLYVRGTELPQSLDLNVLLIDNDIDGCGGGGFPAADMEGNVKDYGPVQSNTKLTLTKSSEANEFGFTAYVNAGSEIASLAQGAKYEIVTGDGENQKQYPVASVMDYRVDSGNKTTVGDQKSIGFSDYVYPIIYNNDVYSDIKIKISATDESLSFDNCPKILRDGNEEVDNQNTENNLKISYAKPANSNEPTFFEDIEDKSDINITDTQGELSLDHRDKLEVYIDDDIAQTYYWDQISKIWYNDKADETSVSMTYIDGGTYSQGEFREGTDQNGQKKPYYSVAYMFDNEGKEVNMKKLWKNILDPEFWVSEGQTPVSGEDAIQTNNTDLFKKNSNASSQSDKLWITNEDSVNAHNVSVSDFWLGKYEITMDQFYEFVQAVSADGTTYNIGDTEYHLNDVAAYMIKNKKLTARDNGWGKGSRPAIDICWYEAIEFCNYLSRVNGLQPYYECVNIYDGEEADGKTAVPFMKYVDNSVMQKNKYADANNNPFTENIQLVKVICNEENPEGYRLPTEAEYEYAARGGKNMSDSNPGYLHSGSSSQSRKSSENNKYVWARKNVENPQMSGDAGANIYKNNMGGNGYSSPVGSLLPNNLGVYDLCGSVWEACWDFYNQSYYKTLKDKNETTADPQGPSYSDAQLSKLGSDPVDDTMAGQYKYTYVKGAETTDEEDGDETRSYTKYNRTGYTDVSNAGKFSHTYRGGCFTSQGYLMETVNRFGPSQVYTDNVINFTDARIGFRVARSTSANDKLGIEDKADNDIRKLFMMLGSNKDYDNKITQMFTSDAALSANTVNDKGTVKSVAGWLSSINRTAYNYYEITDMKYSKNASDEYECTVYARYYDDQVKSSDESEDVKYTLTFNMEGDNVKIVSLSSENLTKE